MSAPKRIAIVGPESSGKTTLARALAAWYDCFWVEEYARGYLSNLKRKDQIEDLRIIAEAQQQLENETAERAQGQPLIICDTTQLVIYIWSMYQYGLCDPWITETWKTEVYNLQLLCSPEIPWAEDPLRCLPDVSERRRVFELYKAGLDDRKAHYICLSGSHMRRLQQATSAIQHIYTASSEQLI